MSRNQSSRFRNQLLRNQYQTFNTFSVEYCSSDFKMQITAEDIVDYMVYHCIHKFTVYLKNQSITLHIKITYLMPGRKC